MRAPVVFFGHGSPVNTTESNLYTEAWRRYGAGLERPRAILAISAHWYVTGTRVCAAARPRTVHDFNAKFPRDLFAYEYHVECSANLVSRIETLLGDEVERDSTWGIDHGTYSVLAHVFPLADVPVVQLSLDRRKTVREHYALARRLAPLRAEGVMIFASGNVVHNLELGIRKADAQPYDWATRFEQHVRALLDDHDHAAAIDYGRVGDDARLAVPTLNHYLPFVYALAQQRDTDSTNTIVRGIAGGANSMLSVAFE